MYNVVALHVQYSSIVTYTPDIKTPEKYRAMFEIRAKKF